jgi:hypothetical protein
MQPQATSDALTAASVTEHVEAPTRQTPVSVEPAANRSIDSPDLEAPPIASPFHAAASAAATHPAAQSAPTAHVEAPADVAPSAKPAPTIAPRPVAPRPIPELPPVTLALPPESGLELVETKSKGAPASEPETTPVGPRRVRPPKVAIVDEPLQIVETQRMPPPGS